PPPEQGRSEFVKAFAAPLTPIQEILSHIWSQVLNVEQVGVDDNFFELGGHSLLAVQVISRVRQTLDVELPLQSIFESPTIAEQARILEASEKPAQPLRPLLSTSRDKDLPLSFAQQRLWFLDQLE